MKLFFFASFIILLSTLCQPLLHGQKRGYRLKVQSEKNYKQKENRYSVNEHDNYGQSDSDEKEDSLSFYVNINDTTASSTKLFQLIHFAGYDKNQSSNKESFFVSNNSKYSLLKIKIEIEYLTIDGRQLHKRLLSKDLFITANETRKIDIPSWDTQKSFYYFRSQPARHPGNSYKVRIHPLQLTFKKNSAQ